MWLFRKTDPLEFTDGASFVSVVGAGGKSTLIDCLAAGWIMRGKRVAVTTTTKIWAKEPYTLFDREKLAKGNLPDFIRVGNAVEDAKLTGLHEREVWELGQYYDLVLIEADGSKGKPLKYPAQYEPVIPPVSDRVLVVAGLDAISHRVDEVVFRSELFTQETGVPGDAHLSEELFLAFFDPEVLLKGVELEKCVIILNKYDACSQRGAVTEIAKLASRVSDNAPVLISSLKIGIFYGLHKV